MVGQRVRRDHRDQISQHIKILPVIIRVHSKGVTEHKAVGVTRVEMHFQLINTLLLLYNSWSVRNEPFPKCPQSIYRRG